ncbi:hypothetical protein GCM10023093_09660 [Nemorincola caseinilytica]|uniref:Peptidase S74 domain-containing protein n=1 Tax=Nemorincola caseinilytica TaxID=2054315 RepID=A0ABP8NAG5_9BACT
MGGGEAAYGTPTVNDTDNQMMMRFAGGYKLYTNAEATVGAQLAPSDNSWSVISDRRKKEKFCVADGEVFLKKIAKWDLGSWNYKGQDAAHHRHYGPMAQDFYAAFGRDAYGVIGNDTTINQADMMGVSMIAIQALERRSAEVAQLREEVAALKAQLNDQQKQNMELRASLGDRLDAIESELRKNNTVTAEGRK